MCRSRSEGEGRQIQRLVAPLSRETHPLEVRKQTIPVPARIAKASPVIVITAITSIPKHGIEDAATTNGSSLRNSSSGAIEIGLRFSLKIPVPGAINIGTDEDRNQDNLLVVVARAENGQSWTVN